MKNILKEDSYYETKSPSKLPSYPIVRLVLERIQSLFQSQNPIMIFWEIENLNKIQLVIK